MTLNPIQHIQLHENEFTKSEQKIQEYVLNHFDVISSFPIATVAEKCAVSKTALLRFCQKCGYRGYSEFKFEISRYLQSGVLVEEDRNESASNMIRLYTEQMNHLLHPLLQDHLTHLADLIATASHIRIFGVHETGLSGQYLSYRLATLGIDSEAITGNNMSEKAGFSKPSDLNIFMSLSAQTSTITDALECSLENQATTVIITQNDHHAYQHRVNLSVILPTFEHVGKNIFLDSQALVLITIDLLINSLARQLNQNKSL